MTQFGGFFMGTDILEFNT